MGQSSYRIRLPTFKSQTTTTARVPGLVPQSTLRRCSSACHPKDEARVVGQEILSWPTHCGATKEMSRLKTHLEVASDHKAPTSGPGQTLPWPSVRELPAQRSRKAPGAQLCQAWGPSGHA